MKKSSKKWTVGIDEVGRGPLAGPVVIATACIAKGVKIYSKENSKLRDSKRLTEDQREKWFKYLKSHPQFKFELARVYPKTIDRINISKAANLAALRAFRRLCDKNKIIPEKCAVFLDGGLYLGNGDRPSFSKTVVRGDVKIKTVAMASIMAKVTRDKIMVKLHKKFPHYGFDENKGYGTAGHIKAIKRHGSSAVHRRSFDPISKALYN